ncbi:MAG: folylpolyglutamate synthase/dihydrofolate synthase family protein [Pseudomonadota bacterium]
MDFSHAIIERLLHLHPKEIDLSLGRIERLLAALGHPEKRLPPVIHVAGTNGKGSTLAFMRAILEADGRLVHAYTSPHLISYHERFRLAGPNGSAFASDDRLADALERCERANEGLPITVFEITTAAGLLMFSEVPADVLLLEVGLGGRVDATNVIDKPAATIITPVSFDHMQFLGDTIPLIAAEKAGIIKPGVPVIVSAQTPEALETIEARADALDAPTLISGRDWQAYEERGRLVYQDLTGDSTGGLMDLPAPKLLGRYQYENAGAAITALRSISDLLPGQDAIERGLKAAEWPARFQKLSQAPITTWAEGAREIWLDGSHNPGGATVLAHEFAELEDKAPAPLHLVCGMLSNKDAGAFLAQFAGLAAKLYAVPIPGETNSFEAEDLASVAREAGPNAEPAHDLESALREAAKAPSPPRILICGSLYLAGHVLRLIRDA